VIWLGGIRSWCECERLGFEAMSDGTFDVVRFIFSYSCFWVDHLTVTRDLAFGIWHEWWDVLTMVGIRGEVVGGCSDLYNENVFTVYHQRLVMQRMCSGSHLQF